ncbi:hypothetical protein DUI87_16195 [Hirundo rustica rustica]|uniref:Uncharacterized protein n=1 Tax=Hirundo rustica rustica TaxID=333673 RepID=A0A3M0K0H1_HIRRU|nr:hypothetical protein DUI87_16195 [Hirundo rustica rustica]
MSQCVLTVATVDACACHTNTKSPYGGIHKVVPECAGIPVKSVITLQERLRSKIKFRVIINVLLGTVIDLCCAGLKSAELLSEDDLHCPETTEGHMAAKPILKLTCGIARSKTCLENLRFLATNPGVWHHLQNSLRILCQTGAIINDQPSLAELFQIGGHWLIDMIFHKKLKLPARFASDP